MPVYDYKCPEHGLFHGLAEMSKSGEPGQCPQCGKLSARVIMIPPEVLAMAPGQKKAMDKNEEAKHHISMLEHLFPKIAGEEFKQEIRDGKFTIHHTAA